MQQVLKTIYEGIMVLLVMLTIATIWTEDTYNTTINWIVWGVFVFDFFIRLIMTEEKWNFIKQNPFLVIAIIPFDQFFQVARIVRIVYLFRIKTITKYYISPFVEKLTYRSLLLVGLIILSLLLVESVVVWDLESSINTYADALYVIIGHLMFFGREIFVTDNTITIWLLTGTSIIGVLIQGLALQWVFTKVDSFYKNRKAKKQEQVKEIN
ncbi:transporter [Virgibacillus ainsalahensis]